MDSSKSNKSYDSLVTHETQRGSRTSISQLPPLPNEFSYTQGSDDNSSDNGDNNDKNSSFVEFDLSKRSNDKKPGVQKRVMSSESDNSELEPKPQLPQRPQDNEAAKPGLPLRPHEKENQDEKPPLPQRHSSGEGNSDADNEDDFFSDKKTSWKTMKTISEMDYYDDQGNLQFSKDQDISHVDKKYNINGYNFNGYTRINNEELMAKYAELDKNTDFLFISKQEVNKRTDAVAPSYREEDINVTKNEKHDDDEEESEYEDENLDSEEALQSTKNMLSEAQKYSYAGIVKLLTVEMATEMAWLKQSTSFTIAKPLSLGQKNFANWSMYITSKIYSHMDLSADEQLMIDNLSAHGLDAEDLVKSFIKSGNKDDENAEVITVNGGDLRWVLICDLFLLLLSDGYYDSRSRTLLIRFAIYLGISKLEVFQFERRLLNSLEVESSTQEKTMEDNQEMLNDKSFINKYIKKNKGKRMAYIGLATIGGTLAIGLSAGLLAPVIGAGLAAGLTTVGITGTGGFLAGVGGTTIITGSGIAIGAKVGSKAGAKRTGDVHTFEFRPLHNNKRANLVITVNGWMNGKADDVRLPFSTVDPVMGDIFSVLWEPEMLQSMGQTIGILASEALSSSVQQILGATVLTSLMAAIQIPMALSKLSYIVDNPWNVSLDRAWKAGKIMADTLISGHMGVRPITLVGFSLGARVIYSCLLDLAQRGCYGLVENVIILGSPVTTKKDHLALVRSVVSGRFINGYSKRDWILGYLFRATGGGLLKVAGLGPVYNTYGIENIDCTPLVEGHMAYRKAMPKILKLLDWEVLSEEFTEIEEPDVEQGERQRQLIAEFDDARQKMREELDQKEKEQEDKGWKKYLKPKQKNWWKFTEKMKENEDQGEGYSGGGGGVGGGVNSGTNSGVNSGTANEYKDDQLDNDRPIFDVTAIMEEIKDIEEVSKKDENTLNKVRQNVDTQPTKHFTRNEDVEETIEPPKKVLENLSGFRDKLGNMGAKIADKVSEM